MRKVIVKLLAMTVVFSGVQLHAKSVEDMLGRTVIIPDKINKIYASSPILLYSLIAIDRSKIAGLNFPFQQGEAAYLDKETVNLPVLGGWFGQGRTPNSEMILATAPDLILLSEFQKQMGESKIKAALGHTEIPLFYLKSDTLEELVETFPYLGKITGNEERAARLYRYGRDTLEEAGKVVVSAARKPRVYYAEGIDGLQTECDGSWHSELITLAGGENVHHCAIQSAFGRQRIGFEQLLQYNPEIILVFNKDFYQKIYQDKKWQFIDAVKEKKVYLIPKGPFSWFDRPPSFMKLLGLKWLLTVFHPEAYPVDIREEAKDFYRLFLGIALTDVQLDAIMGAGFEPDTGER
ncbi:ABC transporter substrate-binding protein [Sulfurovum mangrovi]|uniref:ABC transporter substrate-binding protein n=1 Tax=Sulfurovum mangrovi TaxID=2893889 RepID=UPI001E4F71D3|nr:ABC transporter substrate-binding protein [Sulfurovum mangrovi]UFH58031.1 ABC transporter substrate-binding protein [Sulfurovum mangrovi]